MKVQNEEYFVIEEMKNKRGTPDAVFEGVKATFGWKNGKMVTEKDYDEAVKSFEKSPIDGREVKKNV